MAEQVPTVLSHSFTQQQTAEQNADIPVPGPRPSGVQIPAWRTVEQIVDIPVSRTCAGGGLRRFSSGQGFATLVEQIIVFDGVSPKTGFNGVPWS